MTRPVLPDGDEPAAPGPVLDLDRLPPIVTLPEYAQLLRVSVSTIRRELSKGTFHPQPFAQYPYRWKREDVLADLKRRREPVRRFHGFAARRKPAKIPPATAPAVETPTNAARELADIRTELAVLKWIVGALIAISLAILWRVFTH